MDKGIKKLKSVEAKEKKTQVASKMHEHEYGSTGRTSRGSKHDNGVCHICGHHKKIPAFHSNKGDWGNYSEKRGRYENMEEVERRQKGK